MSGETTSFTTNSVDFYINTIDPNTTKTAATAVSDEFTEMLKGQEVLCQSSAGEIVPNTLDELVRYLDIEGIADEPENDRELYGIGVQEFQTKDYGQHHHCTTFGTEDKWPI